MTNTDADDESIGGAAYGFLVNLVLFWLTVVVIERPPYAGSSLRGAGCQAAVVSQSHRERQPEIE